MLLQSGYGRQPQNWHVLETKAPMYARVYWIMGGKTVYRSGNFSMKLRQNWLYIFPVYATYEMTTDPEDPLDCLYLHLDVHSISLSRPVAVELAADPELNHYLQVLSDAIMGQMPPDYLEVLARGFEKLCLHKHLLEAPDLQTRSYIDLMRKTYRTDVPVARLASSMGYSTEYFIRTFKKHLGVSPHQYAISLRMSDAVRMLTTDATLEEIARAIGYVDDHSFSNAFRRYYGISPSVYRRHYSGFA